MPVCRGADLCLGTLLLSASVGDPTATFIPTSVTGTPTIPTTPTSAITTTATAIAGSSAAATAVATQSFSTVTAEPTQSGHGIYAQRALLGGQASE